MLEPVTGYLTSENLTVAGLGNVPPSLNPAVFVIFGLLIAWAVLFGLAYLVLAIISCVRQKLPLSDLLKRSFNSFKSLVRPMLRYYIPLMILSFIVGIFLLIFNIMRIFTNLVPAGSMAMIVLLLVFIPVIVATSIYFAVLDNSLAKSYYNSLKARKFAFKWISFEELIRLIGLGLVYSIIIIASLFLLGIPLLFLPAISLFLRFPLLNEGKGIGATISKLVSMLRKDFWNLFFFYFIYSLLIGFVSSFIQYIPIIGYMAVMVVVVPFSTLLSAEAYYYLNKNYELAGKKPR